MMSTETLVEDVYPSGEPGINPDCYGFRVAQSEFEEITTIYK